MDRFDCAIDLLEGIGCNRNIEAGISSLEELAYDGNVEAQFCLARFYWSGQYVGEDNGKTIFWYTKAAENGHPFSRLWLGNNYMNGTKTDVDYEKAAYWYQKAIETDVAMAYYNLGLCYLYGLGVRKDEKKGEQLITAAAEKYILIADLTLLEDKRSDLESYEADLRSLAEKYEPLIGEDKEITIQYADACRKGYGVPKDTAQAYKLYSMPILDRDDTALLYRKRMKEGRW